MLHCSTIIGEKRLLLLSVVIKVKCLDSIYHLTPHITWPSKWRYKNWPGVPTPPAFVTSSPGIVVWLFSLTLQPKSPSFTEPLSVRNMFAPNCTHKDTELSASGTCLLLIAHTHTHTEPFSVRNMFASTGDYTIYTNGQHHYVDYNWHATHITCMQEMFNGNFTTRWTISYLSFHVEDAVHNLQRDD